MPGLNEFLYTLPPYRRIKTCLNTIQPLLAALFLDQFQQAFLAEWTVGNATCSNIVLERINGFPTDAVGAVRDKSPIEWDITILARLLLGIPEFRNDELQLSTAIVRGAIKDIRSVRNYLSHLSTETIAEDKFQQLLRKLNAGVKQLPGGHDIDFLSNPLKLYCGPILPGGGARFDSDLVGFLTRLTAANHSPRHSAAIVKVTMPSDFDIVFGGAAIHPKFTAFPGMLMEEDVHPGYYQDISDLLKLVSSMKEDDTTTQRVVVLNSLDTHWSYFIFQTSMDSADGSTNHQIFNMVYSVPSDEMASQAVVDSRMQDCLPEYTGPETDYEAIFNYLISHGIILHSPTAHERVQEVTSCINWLSLKRRKGRLINDRVSVSSLGDRTRREGEGFGKESLILALVASKHRLKRLGEGATSLSAVYSNSFPPVMMYL